MRTSNVITIRAPLYLIFSIASDLARWPDFLPHYRYNRFLSPMPWGGIVKMAAVRTGIPTSWISIYRIGYVRFINAHQSGGNRSAWWSTGG